MATMASEQTVAVAESVDGLEVVVVEVTSELVTQRHHPSAGVDAR